MRHRLKTEEFPDFHICGVGELMDVKGPGWTHVVSIWNAMVASNRGAMVDRLRKQFPQAVVHLAFFDDIDREEIGFVPPTEEDVASILAFSAQVSAGSRVLVHCAAGISRSPAAAFAIACQLAGRGRELEAFAVVERARPQLLPNRLIVRFADHLLNRGGTMVEIVEAHWKRLGIGGWFF